MRIRLRSVIIVIVITFVLIILLRVTKLMQYILLFFSTFGIYVALLAVLSIIGFGIYLIILNKKTNRESDIEAKAWQFVQEWWSDKMGMVEKLKLQDGFMKRGYYDSGQGMTELFIGFNVTKKDVNSRIIFVVGTKPMSIAHVDNSPDIEEKQDPFLNFYPMPPVPVPFYKDEAIKARYAGPHTGYTNSDKIEDKSKKEKEEKDNTEE